MSPAAFQTLIQTTGLPVALLLVAVVALARGWVITAAQYAELKTANAQLKRDVELLRDLVYRNSGSQQTQAQAVQQLSEQLIAALNQGGAQSP